MDKEITDKIQLLRNAVYDCKATPENPSTPYKPRPDDVIIAGYAKTGTTWLQQILHQIRTNGDESFQNIYDVTYFLPNYYHKFDIDLSRDQPGGGPRIFKSHAKYEHIPRIEGRTRFVVITRDPYDAEWSMIKFFWRFFGEDRDMTPEDYATFAEKMNQRGKDEDYAGWFLSWWPHRKDPNVLWLTYEEIRFNLDSRINDIAQFYVRHDIKPKDKHKIFSHCTYEYMLNHAEKFTADMHLQQMVQAAKLEQQGITKKSHSIVRKDGAKIGQGEELLYEEAKKRIDERWKETMEKCFRVKSYRDIIEGKV